MDSGSTHSFIRPLVVRKFNLSVQQTSGEICRKSKIQGSCDIRFFLQDHCYKDVPLSILDNPCEEVILGQDFMRKHTSVEFDFGGDKPPLHICGMTTVDVKPPSLFSNLTPDCTPIAVKSRRYTSSDAKFIESETQKLLSEGLMEPSTSPWRAQVLVTADEKHKNRMVVDYSETVNSFSQLDEYPLIRIDYIVQKIGQYSIYSTLDLKSAYHQVPLREEDKPYTAFESCGRLHQFTMMPFGVTNGVAGFQRTLDDMIKSEELRDTFTYVDNITICGNTQEEHDANLNKFLAAAFK